MKTVKVSVGEGKLPNVLVCLNFSSGWYSFWSHTILTRIVCVKPKRNNMQHLCVLKQQTDILVNIRDLLVSQREKKERLRLRLQFVNLKSLIWKQDDNWDLWSLLGWMVWMFIIKPFCCLSLGLWQCSTFWTHVLTEIFFSALKRKISINSYIFINKMLQFGLLIPLCFEDQRAKLCESLKNMEKLRWDRQTLACREEIGSSCFWPGFSTCIIHLKLPDSFKPSNFACKKANQLKRASLQLYNNFVNCHWISYSLQKTQINHHYPELIN